MKFCEKCGKELLDEATVCVGCGCAVDEQPSQAVNVAPSPLKKLELKQIILIAVAAVVLIGAVVGVIVLKNNGKKKEISEALEGNRYSNMGDWYTRLSFKEDYKCDWYRYYLYIDNELEYTKDYTIEIRGKDIYVIVGDTKYEVRMDKDGDIDALVDEETGDVYD